MEEFDFNNFDLEKLKKEAGKEFKLVYDIFCLYIINSFEGKDKVKYLKSLDKTQRKQMVDWLTKYVIPSYEEEEEFEKCAKLRDIVELLKK